MNFVFKIKDFYYTLWVDIILKIRSISKNKGDWPLSLIFVSISMGFNISTILLILNTLGLRKSGIILNINLFSKQNINTLFGIIVFHILMPMFVNYYLIFYKRKFKKIIKKYQYHNGKYALIYVMTSIWINVLILLLLGLINVILK